MAALTVPVFAPAAAKDLGLDPNYIGYFSSIVFIGAMASSLLSGGFVVRHGAIRVSQFCLVLAAIGIAISAGGALVFLVFSAVVLGIAVGPPTPSSSHILVRQTPAHLRALVFSLKQTAVPLGGVLAGAVVPLLVVNYGWRGAAIGVAVMCLVLIALVQPTRRLFDVELQPREHLFQGNLVGPLILVLKDRGLRGPVLASAAYSALQQTFSVFLVTYLVQGLNMDLVRAGLVLAIAQGAGVGGRIIWGAVADLVGNSRFVLGGIGLASACFAIVVASFDSSWSFAAIVAASAGFGFTAIGWNGVFLAEIARIVPREQVGRATGGALFVTFFGVVAAPPFYGLTITLTGSYGIGFLALAALTCFSGLMLMRSPKNSEAQ